MDNITYYKDGFMIGKKQYSIDAINAGYLSYIQKENNLCMVHISRDSEPGFTGAWESFICKRKERDKFWSLMKGREINFGEIAGLGSEVYGTLGEEDVHIEKNIDPKQEGSDHSFLDAISNSPNPSDLSEKENKFILDFCLQHRQ